MTNIVSIDDLARGVPDGAHIGVGGVHLSRLPMALIRKIIAMGRRNLVFISWGGGLPLELFLEAKAVRRLIFCFSSLDIFGLAPRFREALEQQQIEVEEWSALAMIQGLHAAHFRLPEMPFQLPAGSDLMQSGDFWKTVPSKFGNQLVGQARRLDIDVFLLHAQRADTAGNVEIQGARGLDLAMLGAAQKVLVTAEEIVETGVLGSAPRSFVLPREFVTAVAHEPWGAWPTSCLPYYSTDYRELLRYVRQEQVRRTSAKQAVQAGALSQPAESHLKPNPEPERKNFLVAAASVRPEDLSPAVLQAHRIAPESSEWTIDELMAVCLSREYNNWSVCSVGSVSPLAMVSYLLAKKTHAPQLTIIALNGGFIDIDFHPMSLTVAEPLELATAKACWGGDETYHWYYQQGRITHEVITVAQIDRRGRTNNAWVGTNDRRVRLPGQGGMADVANFHQNFTLYLTRHSRDRFVEAVEICTASRGLLTEAERRGAGLQPGKVQLITDLGVFELNETDRLFHLVSIHPGVQVDQVREHTGGELLIDESLAITQPPTAEQLRQIREDIDPFGIRRLEFVPGRDRLSMIESILKTEADMVEHLNLPSHAGQGGKS